MLFSMTKSKISVSISEEKISAMESLLKEEKFRNKSHIVEVSLDKLLREEKWKRN